MAQENATSVAGAAIRVTRLLPDGTLATGERSSFVTKSFISLGFTPEYETGDEFTTKAADGSVCASWKAPDTLKRVTLSLAICAPDAELTALLSGGDVLADEATKEIMGYKAPAVGTDATPNGVAIEVWSIANVGGRKASTNPYWHWIFPYAQMKQSGERVIQNDLLATAFEGWAVGNTGFGVGPAAPQWAFTSDTPMAYARTASIPTGSGYQLAPAGA